MTITSPDVTLTGTLTDDQGTPLNGTITFTLSGYGSNIPTIAGIQLLPGLTFTTSVTSGIFSTTFYSNQIITPGPLVTFYNIAFQQTGSTNQILNFSKNYQFGPGVFDISQLVPLGSTISNTSFPNSVLPQIFTPVVNQYLSGLSSTGAFQTGIIPLPLVGSAILSGIATNVTPIIPNTFTTLLGIARVTFYAVGDTISLQFGTSSSAVDTGNNYNWRYLAAAAGATTFTDTNGATTNLIRLADSNTTLSRTITFSVSNTSNKTKLVSVQQLTETANVGTLPSLSIGCSACVYKTDSNFYCFRSGIYRVSRKSEGVNNLIC